jgi:spore coat polysaccharide biosynthesis protein SpsF
VTSTQRTAAIIQARMGSKRLPGKVLMPLAGSPMVVRVLERAAAIAGVDVVVAAIPDTPDDDELEGIVEQAGYVVVRGDPEDVLSRYVVAANAVEAEVVVRVTSDCPLLSPTVSSQVVAAFDDCDYASNTVQRTYPRGLDTEVVSSAVLRVADREARTAGEREHVTPFVWRRPERFRLRQVYDSVDRSAMRWTVDTADDLAFASSVYDELGPDFEVDDVLAMLERQPDVGEINRHIAQKTVE